MQKKKKVSDESVMKEKIEYLGLNFKKVPKALIATENLNFKALKGYDERQYKQYKYIKISDIDILLTPTHRLDSLSERYDKASPLYMYLDSEQEENAVKYETFLKMLKKIEIADVEKVSAEQELLAKQIPFKVKFNGNYLWQIYYSEFSERYFMLVPTEDSDYSTFFYLLKKKIENKKNEMIFVPISYLDYSENMLKKTELKDLENYLWLFTKDYPAIYEVKDKKQKETLQIIGETLAYGKIRTLYKMTFNNSKEANKFYKLLKALFILQIELPRYYNFTTNINDKGNLEIYIGDNKIEYEKLPEFVSDEYRRSIELKQENDEEIKNLDKRLEKLKKESVKLEKEYLEKEKIISTFLECKKSFFGKVKYYFTMGKRSKKKVKENEEIEKDEIKEQNEDKSKKESLKLEKRNYTLDELILSFKELEISENNQKSTIQDINAIKLKNKNLKRKIENATSYINEINEHKKSIFEFWKYSNKDEVAALEEGEEEEVNTSKVERTFNYDEDFESFGQRVDKNQRFKFTDAELDGSFIASTDLFDLLQDVYNRDATDLQEFSQKLQELKDSKGKTIEETSEEFDIFGNRMENNKERSLGNQIHRETPRDKYSILDIKKGMRGSELKKALSECARSIKKAIKKNELEEEMYVYKVSNCKMEFKGLQKLSLSERLELNDFILNNPVDSKVYLYRIKIPRGTNFIALSNIILYNNKNMTLPIGMKESSHILIDMSDLNIKTNNTKHVNIEYLENARNDFSNLILRTIEVCEME